MKMKSSHILKKFILNWGLISLFILIPYFLFVKFYVGAPIRLTIYRIIEPKEFVKETNHTIFLSNINDDLWNSLGEVSKFKNKPHTQECIIDIYNLIFQKVDSSANSLFLKVAKSHSCGEVASFYGNIFALLNYKVKVIQLQQSLFSKFQTHILLDIWDESSKKWICIDPTFNIYFKSPNSYNLLGALEVHELGTSQINDYIKIIPTYKNKGSGTIKLQRPIEYITYWNFLGYYKLSGNYSEKYITFCRIFH